MKTRAGLLGVAVAISVFSAARAQTPQDYVSIIVKAKADLNAAGVQTENVGPCGPFQIVTLAAARIPDAYILGKPSRRRTTASGRKGRATSTRPTSSGSSTAGSSMPCATQKPRTFRCGTQTRRLTRSTCVRRSRSRSQVRPHRRHHRSARKARKATPGHRDHLDRRATRARRLTWPISTTRGSRRSRRK